MNQNEEPTMSDRVVRIAGASACEFDSTIAVPQLLGHGEHIDYLMCDELAELNVATMAGAGKSVIGLAAEEAGFARSFVDFQVGPYLPELLAGGTKILANAGGPNPRACASHLAEFARGLGVRPKIAYVEGDNLLGRHHEIAALGLEELASGEWFDDVARSADRVLTLLAYIGALPIAQALGRGADIVITGRAVDSAPALGALIHEFGWSPDDADLMAAGSLIGHVLECGPQATGATFTDWRDVPDWTRPSYPIAECRPDGSAVFTVPDGSGGIATVGTISEQLLYEVGDPQAYVLPDVVCDLSEVTVAQIGPNRVLVEGARGHSRTPTYKLQTTFERGWRGTVMSPIVGFEAAAKGDRMADALFAIIGERLENAGLDPADGTTTQILGAGDSLGAHADAELRARAREVVVRMTMDHRSRDAAELFLREQGVANVGHSVGVAMPMGHGVHPIVRMRSFLLDKREVQLSVVIDGDRTPVAVPATGEWRAGQTARHDEPELAPGAVTDTTVPLIALAWARSGDKGDLATIAVIARERELLPYIGAALSAEAVAGWLAHQFEGDGPHEVDRYYSPGPGAFSFILHGALGGGQLESRRLDPMAKTIAQQLLAFPVPVPAAIAASAVAPAA
jgi:hypothetical protein